MNRAVQLRAGEAHGGAPAGLLLARSRACSRRHVACGPVQLYCLLPACRTSHAVGVVPVAADAGLLPTYFPRLPCLPCCRWCAVGCWAWRWGSSSPCERRGGEEGKGLVRTVAAARSDGDPRAAVAADRGEGGALAAAVDRSEGSKGLLRRSADARERWLLASRVREAARW